MSNTQTTAPTVKRVGDTIDTTWDTQIGATTAWERIRVRRTSAGNLIISSRESGPVEIPQDTVGLIMSLVEELIPEAVA